MLKDSVLAGIMFDENLDKNIRSLISTLLYTLKGISAYCHPARFINFNSDQADHSHFLELEAATNDNLTLEDMIRMCMRAGEMNVEVMKILDGANTSTYKNPTPNKVSMNPQKGPFIIVSGHDLRDLEILLIQTEGKNNSISNV